MNIEQMKKDWSNYCLENRVIGAIQPYYDNINQNTDIKLKLYGSKSYIYFVRKKKQDVGLNIFGLGSKDIVLIKFYEKLMEASDE